MKAIGLVPVGKNGTHGIRLLRNRTKPVNDTTNAIFVQHQAVHHRRAQPLFATVIEVLGVRLNDLCAIVPNGIGRTDQCSVLTFR